MSDSTTMVTDLTDLMGCSHVATEQQFTTMGDVDAFYWLVQMLGLPFPSDVMNTELSMLKPIYIWLLNDVWENKESSIYLQLLFDSSSETDAAILLLYVIEYLSHVQACHGDMTGIQDCLISETFECMDIIVEIAAKMPLLGIGA